MTCDDVHEREVVAAYVQRRLSEADRDLFEEHVLACERCFADLQDYRVMREALAATSSAAPAQTTMWARRAWPLAGLAAAAAIVMAVLVSRQRPPSAPAVEVARAPEPANATSVSPPRSGPSRAELVGQLARFDPPVFKPSRLRGVDGAPNPAFDRAMTAYRAGHFSDAATALREVRPQTSETLFYLGVSDLRAGRVADGVAGLQRVIATKDPIFDEDARFFLARGLLQAGDITTARTTLEQVVALKGDRASEARALLDAIDRLPPA